MVNADPVAVAAIPSGGNHGAAVGGVDGRAVPGCDVQGAVVGGGPGHADIPVAEVGGNNAAAGPAQAARSRPGGPLLGAPGLQLRGGLAQGDRCHHIPVHLGAVDIGDVGGNVLLAVYAGLQHLVVAFIDGRVILVFYAVGHVLQIALPLHIHHCQIGNSVADGQRIAGVDQVGLVAGVQTQEPFHAHLMLQGDVKERVPALYGVGHGALLGGVKLFGNIAQVHHQVGGHILLTNVHILHEIALHGLVGDIAGFQLLQQLLHGALILRGCHRLVIHIQHIAVGHLSQLPGELCLKLLLGLHGAAGHDAGLSGQQGGVYGVAVVAKGLAGNVLNIRCRLAHDPAGGHGAQIHAVIAYRYADGVQTQGHGDGGHGHSGA